MKQILLSTIFFLVNFYVSAQASVAVSPDLVMIDVDAAEFETVANSYIKNNSQEEKTFRWIRIVESISDGWSSAICDINACYAVQTDSTPIDFLLKLAPGDSSMLDVHIRPGGLDGSAKINVRVEEVGDTSNHSTASYLFNQVTSTRDVVTESIKIYPNPASHYFQLSDYSRTRKVVIYNLVGREMGQYNVFPGSQIDISKLELGIYLVRLLDQRQKVVKTLRLKKN